MFKWIEKKDLVYWLLIMLVVWLLTSNYDITLSKWSFAGTIISIILAVLAIIYSFDQSSTTMYSTRKLEESALKIENVTNVLNKTSIDELFSDLALRIDYLNFTFDKNMDSRFSDINNKLDGFFVNSRKTDSGNNLEILTVDEWKQYLTDRITSNSIEGSILIYSYLTYANKLNFNLSKLSDFLNKKGQHQNEKEKNESRETIRLILVGATISFQSLNVFKMEDDATELNITSISKNFSDAITEIFESDISPAPLAKDIIEFIEFEKSH